MTRLPPRSTLFPSPTLSRSHAHEADPPAAIDEADAAHGQELADSRCRLLVDRLCRPAAAAEEDRKSTRLNSSHANISYAVFCLKKKNNSPSAILVLIK